MKSFKQFVIESTKSDVIRIYHGSVTVFPTGRFDLKYVGTSHGLTEGWGAYFSADVSNARKFGKNIYTLDIPKQTHDMFMVEDSLISTQTNYVQQHLKWFIDDMAKQDPTDIVHRASGYIRSNPRSTSNHDIHNNIKKLQFDADALVRYLDTIENPHTRAYYKSELLGVADPTGGIIYRILVSEYGGNEKAASKMLNTMGIVGKIFSSNRDLHSVVPANNYLIWNQDVLDGVELY